MKNNFDFSGYVTKYNVVCSDGRTIAPEAFKDCDGKVLPLTDCTGLQTTDNVIGHITLQHRSDGVYGYGQFNNSPLARAYKMIVKDHVMNKLGIYANKIKETDKIVTFGVIRSVSICFNGANPEAYIDSIAGQKMEKIRTSKTKLTAHWIDISDATTDNGGYDWHIRDLQCDNCGNLIRAYHGPRYCDECGARMVKNGNE